MVDKKRFSSREELSSLVHRLTRGNRKAVLNHTRRLYCKQEARRHFESRVTSQADKTNPPSAEQWAWLSPGRRFYILALVWWYSLPLDFALLGLRLGGVMGCHACRL